MRRLNRRFNLNYIILVKPETTMDSKNGAMKEIVRFALRMVCDAPRDFDVVSTRPKIAETLSNAVYRRGIYSF